MYVVNADLKTETDAAETEELSYMKGRGSQLRDRCS